MKQDECGDAFVGLLLLYSKEALAPTAVAAVDESIEKHSNVVSFCTFFRDHGIFVLNFRLFI